MYQDGTWKTGGPLGELEETSLVVQCLGLQASNAEGTGSTPGRETKIPHAVRQLNPCATATELAS